MERIEQATRRTLARGCTALALSCLALAAVPARPASAEVVKCQRAVAKASAKYPQDRAKALARCEGLKVKGTLASGTVCESEAKTVALIGKAAAKLRRDLATGCGGKDKICGVDPDAFDDRLNVGMINTSSALPPGQFVRVDFDCRADESAPTLASFSCSATVSTLEGDILPATCSATDLTVVP